MNTPTVGENRDKMKDLALEIMRDNYKAADYAAKENRLTDAANHLKAAERWRLKAREHGATI